MKMKTVGITIVIGLYCVTSGCFVHSNQHRNQNLDRLIMTTLAERASVDRIQVSQYSERLYDYDNDHWLLIYVNNVMILPHYYYLIDKVSCQIVDLENNETQITKVAMTMYLCLAPNSNENNISVSRFENGIWQISISTPGIQFPGSTSLMGIDAMKGIITYSPGR